MRERARETARTEILRAAEACLSELGPDASMESVAARAGVAVGTLYNHFKSRDALVETVLRARYEALDERLRVALAPPADFTALLERFVATIFRDFTEHATLFALLLHPTRVQPRNAGHGPGVEIMLRHAGFVFDRGVAECRVTAEAAALQRELVVGCIRAALLWLLVRPFDARAWHEAQRRTLAFVMQGLGAR